MVLLFLFAFLAGIITVLSPCILPILPALLAAGTTQGKWRPLGIIAGLICSFSFFTLALTTIVQATGLSPTILRNVAIAFIFLFGLVMIFPKLSAWFAKLTTQIAGVGQTLQPTQPKGFWGGVFFGMALGLLWTPCAGPILATITTLVATRSVTLTAVFLTLAYSLGAALPLFFIAYGSSKIIAASRLLSKHAEGIRRSFGVVMLLFGTLLAFRWDVMLEQKLLRYIPQVFSENSPQLEKELKKLKGEMASEGKAPALSGIVEWINSPPLTLEELKGKVVLIDFWTYSCINCLRTLPYLEKWDEAYRDQGLVIIGVHTPEFEFEKDSANVAAAVKQLGIKYPVALDNNYKTWQAYHNQYWPAHYLIDQKGDIRMVHTGEGAYVETENGIRALLGLSPLMMPEIQKEVVPLTVETYLGTARGNHYAPEIALKNNEVKTWSYTSPLAQDTVGLKGLWRAEEEYIQAESEESYLDLNFEAKQVYLVLAGTSQEPLVIFVDGKPFKTLKIEGDKKYDIAQVPYGRHQLSLKVPKGIRAYAFTFGND